MLTAADARQVPSLVSHLAPDATWLYRLYDADLRLLYVGVTRWAIAHRFNGHSREKPWWPDVSFVDLTAYGTGDLALTAERLAIRSEAPAYNRRSRINPAFAPSASGVIPERDQSDSGAVLVLACARGSGSMEHGSREHGSTDTLLSVVHQPTVTRGGREMNGQAINALGFLMHEIRPEWDTPGCVAALRKLGETPLQRLALTAIRYAADERNLTPGNLPNIDNRAWDADWYLPCKNHPLTRARRTNGECASCWADRVAVTEPQPLDRRGTPPSPEQRQQMLTAITRGDA